MQKIKPKEIHQKEDGIDFKIVWLMIIESTRFIVLVTLAPTIATAIFVYFSPTYSSSSTILRSLFIGLILSLLIVLFKARNKIL
jgi:uncharacterized protein involved in exopolysaccharide biosynthesis